MGELIDLFSYSVCIECLDSVHDLRVQSTSSLLQEPSVGNFVRKSMLERVDAFRKELRLVEKFGCLKVGQAAI